MYADREPGEVVLKHIKNPTTIQTLYSQVKSDPDFAYITQNNSLMATFDDHDYGQNNGDKHFKYKQQSQKYFWDFIGEDAISKRRQQNAVYTSYIHSILNGEVTYKVILLDTRSNKDTKGTLKGDFLGEEQWAWLETELNGLDKFDFVLLGTPIQFLPTGKLVEESWIEFPEARSRLYSLMKAASGYTDIILLSGDVHCGEILQAKCKFSHDDAAPHLLHLYEFTSSGLSHTFTQLVDQAEGGTGELFLTSRGIHHQLLYDLYQAIVPARYRELHYAHHFQGPHFALIDVLKEEGALLLTFRYLDHSGLVVMEKSVKMRSKRERQDYLAYLLSPQHATLQDGVDNLVCEPYWGEISKTRDYFTRSVIAFYLLIIVVLPMMLLLWLVGSSVYFIACGAESERRRIILERNRSAR